MSYQNFVQCRVVTPVAANASDMGIFDAVAPYVLPPLDGGLLVLADSPTKPSKVEVVKYAYRTALGLYGLQRGQEGTTAQEWVGPVYAYQALTAGGFHTALEEAVQENAVLLGDSTILDMALGDLFAKTVTQAVSFTVVNVPASTTIAALLLHLTNGGAHAIEWWPGLMWANSTPPQLTVNGSDLIGAISYDGGNTWIAMVLARAVG